MVPPLGLPDDAADMIQAATEVERGWLLALLDTATREEVTAMFLKWSKISLSLTLMAGVFVHPALVIEPGFDQFGAALRCNAFAGGGGDDAGSRLRARQRRLEIQHVLQGCGIVADRAHRGARQHRGKQRGE